ncbi:MAG: extracellular solute-binding protein [Clostridiales bacterium]|nr:extracellular solute-binding protein [Clostridiales bacterium]
MTIKRVLTLFLCFTIIIYIITGPILFKKLNINYINYYKVETKEPDWKGIISFWDYPNLDTTNGSRFGWIQKRIKEFEKNNPGIYIDFRPLSAEDGRTTLMASAKIGANPDIGPIGSEVFFISSGFLEPLDSYFTEDERKDYKDEALEEVTYKECIYGIPWAARGYTLLLNKKIFEERNVELPPEGQWTYEEFVESLKKLTSEEGKRGTENVYGINGYIDLGCYNISGLLMVDGARFIDDNGNYAFNGPEALKGLTKLYELKHVHKVTHPQFGEMNKEEALMSFLQGKSAVLMADAWMVPYIRNMAGKYNVEFTVAGYPVGDSELPLYMNNTYLSYGVFKQSDPNKIKACVDFIKYITDKSFTEELANLGYFSPRKSGDLLYIEDEEMQRISISLNYAEPLPKNKNWWEIDAIIQYNLREMLVFGKSPEEVMRDMEEQVKKYFNSQKD